MLDLTQLSIEDLVKLQNDLPRALEKKQNEQRKLFIAGIEELAKKLAITDILTALQPYLTRLQNKQKNANATINAVSNFAKPSIVPAKYRDPMNFNRTWAGRGSKPNWVNEYLSANPDKTIDDLLIKNNTNDTAQTSGISRRAIAKQITNLKNSNLLRRIGPDKGGHWEIVEE